MLEHHNFGTAWDTRPKVWIPNLISATTATWFHHFRQWLRRMEDKLKEADDADLDMSLDIGYLEQRLLEQQVLHFTDIAVISSLILGSLGYLVADWTLHCLDLRSQLHQE